MKPTLFDLSRKTLAFLFLCSLFCFTFVRSQAIADEKNSLAELLERGRQGNVQAQRLLGLMYRDGSGVERNFHEAVRWSRLAADQGDGLALDDLGFLYYVGWGVPQDFDIAMGYYKAAGRAGNSRGLFNLGECYFSGLGGEQSYERARECWQKAARAGSGQAALALAMMVAAGDGVTRDLDEAQRWAEMALKTSPSEALVFLGELQFQRGQDEKAIKSWQQAARKKNAEATDLLSLMEWRRRKPEPGKFAFVSVPHVHQGYNNCGATTATMLVQFQGVKAAQYQVKRLCPSPIGTGTDWRDLIAAAGQLKLRWELVTFHDDAQGFAQGVEMLHQQLDAGRPVIIDFTVPDTNRPGEFAGHTLLVVGYVAAKDWFILQDPARDSPGLRVMSAAELKKLWHSRGYSSTARGSARPAIVIAKE